MPSPSHIRATLSGALLLASLACQPEIGDSCTNANDCSVQDPRTCDTTFPGGYCTVFGCGADTCPGEATCIGFQSVVSIAPECANLQSRPRLQRTACMRSCSRDGDCRGGYVCVDIAADNSWGAVVVDEGRGTRVCALAPPLPASGEVGVCEVRSPGDLPAEPRDAGPPAVDADAADAG